MASKAIDILAIIVSGIISFAISTSNPGAGNAEMDALWLFVLPAAATLGSIVVFVFLNIFFRRFYNKYRWWIIGILAVINILVGFYMQSYQLIK
jgi:hypothetical protein